MKISKKLHDAINAQINAELWSAYLYLSMATHFENEGLSGIANWFKVQFKEEQAHAEILMNHLYSRGERVLLAPIAEVPTSWAGVLEAFKDTLAHEEEVTALIYNLYAIAEEDKDYAARNMLNWFVDEQVEEEEQCHQLIDHLNLVGVSGMSVCMLDKELAAREYHTPSPLK